jgi:5-methylcytosine-specific restriction protein A
MQRSPWQRTGRDIRLRGRAGQKQRARRLARTDGLCEHCLKEDRVTLATVVNHIVPLARGGADTDENTENLCDEHDAIVTAEQFGKAEPVKARGIGRDGRPTSSDHPWNMRS